MSFRLEGAQSSLSHRMTGRWCQTLDILLRRKTAYCLSALDIEHTDTNTQSRNLKGEPLCLFIIVGQNSSLVSCRQSVPYSGIDKGILFVAIVQNIYFSVAQ